MDPEFWHEMWRSGRIPFHQGRTNEALLAHFGRLGVAPGTTLFVPLCGKAVDMRWLVEGGYRVLGIELSPLAVAGFFAEHGIECEHQPGEPFERYRGAGLTLLCGDVFDLGRDDLAEVGAVYDRAALVAFPEDRRRRYVDHLLGVLPGGAPWLLVTLEYPPGELRGPPFSVGEAEVRALFEERVAVERLATEDVLGRNPGLAARGATRLLEHAFRIG